MYIRGSWQRAFCVQAENQKSDTLIVFGAQKSKY